MKQGESHQRCVARVVWVDWTGSRGVHVAEQTLDLPQRDSASSVRHLKIKEWYVKNHQGPLIVLSAGSLQSSVTLIVRSSLPSETRTLIGGSVGLVSWVSTVALMAFWQRTITVDENITEQTHTGEGNTHLQDRWAMYLEKLKQHMVEVGWHIDNVEGLAGVFSCERNQSIDHMTESTPVSVQQSGRTVCFLKTLC